MQLDLFVAGATQNGRAATVADWSRRTMGLEKGPGRDSTEWTDETRNIGSRHR